MCFNPGDGKVVLEAYIMEELANALNERFVTAGFDRVVHKKTHAVHTVCEEIDPVRSAGKVLLGVPSEPLQGMVIALISPVLLVGRDASIQLNSAGSVMTGPHSEVSEVSER